ncbi:MAG: carbon monoxide dehydrogenase [Dehalococcoidia bacterium]|nr:carbon monoxide dehydrogenase [Dehalococcoidia bacterium]
MEAIDYAVPNTVEEAIEILSSKGEKARVLAGGTDLLVQLRGGRYSLDTVIDVKNIDALNTYTFDSSKGLEIGSAVELYRIYQDPELVEVFPGLMDAATLIGGIQIQGRATFGGNLCNSAPSGDGIPALIAHNAVCNIAGPKGNRQLSVEEFCVGPGRNAMDKGEILVSISVPIPAKGFGSNYQRFIPRNEMDIAVVGVGTSVVVDDSGTKFESARIALASVGPTPIFVTEAGEFLAGKEINDENIAKAAEMAKNAASPITDMRGTIDQRKHLVEVFTRRTIVESVSRAKGLGMNTLWHFESKS